MLENAEAALERELDRSEGLLLNLMPTSIASRLKNDPNEIIADHFNEVTILFADIVGFTPRASQSPPHEVRYLNRVFSQFDRLAEKYRLEKIKTIGDAYMVAGGMPDPLLENGSAIETANIGSEGAFGLFAAMYSRVSFNRCLVQLEGAMVRCPIDKITLS
jgi:adenylate cyclase